MVDQKKMRELESFIKEQKSELSYIDDGIHTLKRELIDRTPTRFSYKDIARAFFGSLLVAAGFVLKGAMLRTSVRLELGHIISIIVVSLIILTVEIYYFGYRKVKDKRQRKPFQFIAKRLPTCYLVSAVVSTGLVFMYGINNDALITSNLDVFKVIVTVSFPASLGAGMSDVLKKY